MENLFLIVEDDPQIRSFINFALDSQDYSCLEASTGQEALKIIETRSVSILILDLGLPDLDGLEVIRKIRTISDLPIIVVSARDQDTEKVEALDAGADDYLTKPFSVNELLARIRVALRHAGTLKTETVQVHKVAELEVDLSRHRVMLGGKEVHFTPMEFSILALLVINGGKVLTHKHILKEVWGSSFEHDLQSLRVFMANIRRKLQEDPAKPRYIVTEVGVGYRFSDE